MEGMYHDVGQIQVQLPNLLKFFRDAHATSIYTCIFCERPPVLIMQCHAILSRLARTIVVLLTIQSFDRGAEVIGECLKRFGIDPSFWQVHTN